MGTRLPSPRAARLRRALRGLAVLAGVYAALQLAAWLPGVREALRERAERALRARVGEVALGPVAVDPLFRVVAGPLALGGTPAAPAVTVERLRLRAAPLALLAGRLEIASLRLHGVRVDATRPAALRALADRRASPATSAGAASRPRAWPRVHVRGLTVAVPLGGAPADLGPFDLDVWPEPDLVRAEARLPDAGRIALQVGLPGGEPAGELRVALRAQGLHAGALGEALRAHLPADIRAGAAAIALDASAPRDLSRASGSVTAGVDGLVVQAARLDPAPVGPFRLAASGELAWDRAGRTLSWRGGQLALGSALAAALFGQVRLEGALPFELALDARHVAFAAFAASLPPGLGPPDEAPRPPGDLDAQLALSGALREPATWRVEAGLDLARMRAAARKAPPVALRDPFRYAPEGGAPFTIGPENPDYVPIAELPEHVVRAVTTSEDAGFFGHAGFDFDELTNALQAGLEQGRVVRGGSTITQQVAKNLWLTRDKVLARKVREALGAIALEATLPKPRILEIYLNLAEWGPGVFGIGPAARHWFGKDARALTVKEAAFLAAVIPNPVRADAVRAQGAPTPYLEQRVQEILLHMAQHGVITDDGLIAALAEPLVFATDPAPASAVEPAAGP
ncbi:MAG: biosynthetic peptidoglycan transglycosylase [Anaeromyxobacter sp.]